MDTLVEVRPFAWLDEFTPSHRGTRRQRSFLSPAPFVTDVPVPRVETPCASNPNMFSDNAKNALAADESRRLCVPCPNFEPCREYGLAHPREPGTYGGLTQRERKHRARKAT